LSPAKELFIIEKVFFLVLGNIKKDFRRREKLCRKTISLNGYLLWMRFSITRELRISIKCQERWWWRPFAVSWASTGKKLNRRK
jgi:hypothetical protein